MTFGALAIGLSALLASTQAPEEDPAPFKWVLKVGDQFDMVWTYEFVDKTALGRRGRVPIYLKDKREVKALLTCSDVRPQWRLAVHLMDAKWAYSTHEYSILASKRDNREPDARVRLLIRDTKDRPGATLEVFDVANTRSKDMKKLLKASYSIALLNRQSGEFWTNGRTGRAIESLFQKSFVHTKWPMEEEIRVGLKWEESTKDMSPGLPRLETMEMKVVSIGGRKGAQVTGKGKETIRKQLMPGRNLTAEYAIDREFTFDPEGFLTYNKEVQKYFRQLTANEAIYREKVSVDIIQTLKITRVKPKRGSSRKR